MSRRLTFALAAALLVASAPASAWQPSIVGFDTDTTAATTDGAPVLAASAPASAWQPSIVGLEESAVSNPEPATVLAASQPAARVTPEMVSEAAEADRAQGPVLASAPAGAPGTAPERGAEQMACVCPGM